MALINCPECGHRISDQSTACPSCGFPTPRPTPSHLPQENYDNNYLYQEQESNGHSNSIIFLLAVAFICYWLFSGDDNYSEEVSQYNEYQSQSYEEPTQAQELVQIPMLLSGSNEDGRYFLISHSTSNNIERINYVRRGDASDSFGKMQINCINNKIKKTSSDNPDSLVSANLGDWHTPTPDWTDQDIVNFICK